MSPLPWIAVGWWVGLSLWDLPGYWVSLGALLVAALAFVRSLQPVPLSSRVRPTAVLCLAAFVAGVGVQVREQRQVHPPSGLCRLVVDVMRVRHEAADRVSARVTVVSGERLTDKAPVLSGVHLLAYGLSLPEGARVQVLAEVSPRQPFRNITPHAPWPDPEPVTGRATLSATAGYRVVSQPLWRGWVHQVRAHVRRAVQKSLSPRAAGIVQALVLGDGRAVDPTDQQQVRAAGLSHVLAVSGLHVSIAVGCVVWLLTALLLRTRLALTLDVRRVAHGLGVGLVLAYAPLAGGSPSAWRAAVTAAIAWSLSALGKRANGPAVCAAAVLVLSALRPTSVWDLGFVLSVGATAALVSTPQRVLEREGEQRVWWLALWSGVTHSLALTTRAFVATAPVVLWVFGALPWVAIVANLLLVPVASLILLPLATLHALAASMSPWLAAWTAPLVSWVIEAFTGACGVAAQVPGWVPPPLTVVQGLCVALGCAACLWLTVVRLRVAVVLACVLCCLVSELHVRVVEQPRDVVRATFLDVGQGDAALVDLPDGRLLVVDTGGNPGGGPDPGKTVLLPLLRARRRDAVDLLVLSHPHPDHYGGLRALVDAGFVIDELWDTGQAEAETSDGELSKLLATLRARGTRVLGPAEVCDQVHRFGAASLKVLWPCPAFDAGFDPNDNSFVLGLQHGDHRVLFTGDIEAHAEAALVAQGVDVAADVLKVPHHGSRTSSGQALLDAVGAKVAVVSAGRFNRFGHPHADVVSRLSASVPTLLRIDERGAVEMTSDGHALRWRSWQQSSNAVQGTQYIP